MKNLTILQKGNKCFTSVESLLKNDFYKKGEKFNHNFIVIFTKKSKEYMKKSICYKFISDFNMYMG